MIFTSAFMATVIFLSSTANLKWEQNLDGNKIALPEEKKDLGAVH